MSLRPVPPEKVVRALVKAGFKPLRQRGSHLILKHENGRVTVVPIHRGEEIDRSLLLKIIRDAGISKEDFLSLLDQV